MNWGEWKAMTSVYNISYRQSCHECQLVWWLVQSCQLLVIQTVSSTEYSTKQVTDVDRTSALIRYFKENDDLSKWCTIAPSYVVCDLGIYLDSNLSMTAHISKTVLNCFAAMRLICSVCHSVSKAVLLSLVTALVLSRVDFGNATLAGLPACQLCRLQSVLHATARIVFRARKFDHVTPLFRELHWLRIPERITFKLSCLVFRSLNGTAPVYLADSINSINRATDVTTRRSLRSSSSTAVVVPVTRCSTIGDRIFPVVAARAWNSLPSLVTLSSSLSTFKHHLKTYLFATSY